MTENRIVAAQLWIRDNLGRSEKITKKYTYHNIKNIIECEIGYVSNEDVHEALSNDGYLIDDAGHVNIPSKDITAFYVKFGWTMSRKQLHEVLR